MAVTMSDGPNRKACDRCHSQKLSCKRVGDEACERCTRLKTECKSSPSLRYRKQNQQTLAGGVARRSIPSPKRQRTDAGSQVVQPDLSIVKSQPDDTVSGNPDFGDNVVVSPEAMLDMVDFDFSFGNPNFYPGNPSPTLQQQQQQQQQQQHLQQPFTSAMEDLMSGGDAVHHAWSPQQSTASESAFTSPAAPEAGPSNRVYLGSPAPQRLSLRPGQADHGTSPHQQRPRRRAKQRARQITLRPAASGRGPSAEEWMPRIMAINSRLFELSSGLPHQTEGWENPDRSGTASSPDGGASATTPFPIDEMFKLSRHFAEILTEMAPPVEGASPASEDDQPSQPAARGLDSLADPATCLFVLSTYVRLLDTYQKVFSCIHYQVAHSQLADLFQSWKLPGVSVGSFAVESSPSLQMSLTVQLAEEFLLQMRRAASALDPSLRPVGEAAGRPPETASMFTGVVDVSFQALKRQEMSLGQELKGLRKDMESFLDG